MMTPLRLKRYETEPGSAIVPPLRVTATRTSDAARLRLSERHSIMIATPLGPYPSYIIVCQSDPPDSRPAPRFTARSILSAGIEFFFAFAIASKSVGFPSTSGPPLREATSIALMSFAKFFARRLSMTAFLCLVVAHLEWPDIGTPQSNNSEKFVGCTLSAFTDLIKKVAMDRMIIGQFGVKTGCQKISLSNCDRVPGGSR